MNLNTAIEKAEALYLADDHAFASKAAQKDAMGYLNYAFKCLRDADRKALAEKVWSEFPGESESDVAGRVAIWERYDLPFDLHQYRPAKHDTMWLSAMRCEVANQLVTLRQLYKDAAIVPKQQSIASLMKQREQQASKAVKDDGFRVPGLQNEFHYCRNEHGTEWYRCDWYKQGRRTSFISICDYVSKCHDAWEAAGKPNMAEMNYPQISEFYKEVA